MRTLFKITAAVLFIFSANAVNAQDSFTFKNHAPVLQFVVPVQEIIQGEVFEINIAENTFADIDQGDKISLYNATLHNGEKLPEWIRFNEEDMTFTGQAEEEHTGEYFIALTAYDSFNAKSVTEIYLRVE